MERVEGGGATESKHGPKCVKKDTKKLSQSPHVAIAAAAQCDSEKAMDRGLMQRRKWQARGEIERGGKSRGVEQIMARQPSTKTAAEERWL